MNEIKDKTSESLNRYYLANRNLKRFIEVARKMLVLKGTSPLIRGEICEVVLSIILEEFIAKNNLKEKGWFIENGLILQDKNNQTSEYLTELDRVLFTPKMIYVFECKSYKGDKILRDKGSLFVKNGNKESFKLDVFEQNRKHSIALLKYILPYLKNKTTDNKLVKMAMFDFSIGEYNDEREDKYKGIFPLVDDKSVLKLFSNYSSKEDCWDTSAIKKEMSLLSKNKKELTEKHLNYVKGLRGK